MIEDVKDAARRAKEAMQAALSRGDRPTHRRHGHTCPGCGHRWWHDPDACQGEGATYASCADAHVCSQCGVSQRAVDLSICDREPGHTPAAPALPDPVLGAIPVCEFDAVPKFRSMTEMLDAVRDRQARLGYRADGTMEILGTIDAKDLDGIDPSAVTVIGTEPGADPTTLWNVLRVARGLGLQSPVKSIDDRVRVPSDLAAYRPGSHPAAPIGAASESAEWAALEAAHGPGGWRRLGAEEVVRGDRRLSRISCALPDGAQSVTYFARTEVDPAIGAVPKILTFPVGGAAYLPGDKRAAFLTHSVDESGEPLCRRVKAASLIDDMSWDGEGSTARAPTCPLCLKRDPRFQTDPAIGAVQLRPVKVEVYKSDGRWVASVWGKGAAIVRPVPGNVHPARRAVWETIDAAIAELPDLVGAPVEVVMIDGVLQDPILGAAPLPAGVASVKRAANFAETGEYDVVLASGARHRIYRDTSQFSHALWHLVDSDSPHGLGETQTEALEALVRTEVPRRDPRLGAAPRARGWDTWTYFAVPPGGVGLVLRPEVLDRDTFREDAQVLSEVDAGASPGTGVFRRRFDGTSAEVTVTIRQVDPSLGAASLPAGQALDPQPKPPKDPTKSATLGGGRTTWDPASQKWLSTPVGADMRAVPGHPHGLSAPAPAGPATPAPGAAAAPSVVQQVFGAADGLSKGIGGLLGAIGGGGAGGPSGAVGAFGGLGDLGLGAAGAADPPPQAILDAASRTEPIEGGDTLYALTDAYGRSLFAALTPRERQQPRLLPGMGGTGRSGGAGWLDAKLRPALARVGAVPDGEHAFGVASHGGAFFLVRLAHHTWTTNAKGEAVPGSFDGIEAYRVPADLDARVPPGQRPATAGLISVSGDAQVAGASGTAGFDPVSWVEIPAPGGYRVRVTGDVLRRGGVPVPMCFRDSVAAARALGAIPPTRALSAAALAAARAAGTAVVMPQVPSPDPAAPGAHPVGTALGDRQAAAYAAAYPPPLPAGSTVLRYGGHKDMILDPSGQPGPDGFSALRERGPGSMVLAGGLKADGGTLQAGVKSEHDDRWADYSQAVQLFDRRATGPNSEPVDLLAVVSAGGPLGGPLPAPLAARLGGGAAAPGPSAPGGPGAGGEAAAAEAGPLGRAAGALGRLWG